MMVQSPVRRYQKSHILSQYVLPHDKNSNKYCQYSTVWSI